MAATQDKNARIDPHRLCMLLFSLKTLRRRGGSASIDVVHSDMHFETLLHVANEKRPSRLELERERSQRSSFPARAEVEETDVKIGTVLLRIAFERAEREAQNTRDVASRACSEKEASFPIPAETRDPKMLG